MSDILILEDDYTVVERLTAMIGKEFSSRLKVETLATESEFCLQWLPAPRKVIPRVFVIDIMLRWTDPAPDAPDRPPEVIEGGFHKAGLRCVDLIKSDKRFRNSRIILYTSLADDDLKDMGGRPQGVMLVTKNQDGNELIRLLREIRF